jgi:hypothetical protein
MELSIFSSLVYPDPILSREVRREKSCFSNLFHDAKAEKKRLEMIIAQKSIAKTINLQKAYHAGSPREDFPDRFGSDTRISPLACVYERKSLEAYNACMTRCQNAQWLPDWRARSKRAQSVSAFPWKTIRSGNYCAC